MTVDDARAAVVAAFSTLPTRTRQDLALYFLGHRDNPDTPGDERDPANTALALIVDSQRKAYRDERARRRDRPMRGLSA